MTLLKALSDHSIGSVRLPILGQPSGQFFAMSTHSKRPHSVSYSFMPSILNQLWYKLFPLTAHHLFFPCCVPSFSSVPPYCLLVCFFIEHPFQPPQCTPITYVISFVTIQFFNIQYFQYFSMTLIAFNSHLYFSSHKLPLPAILILQP